MERRKKHSIILILLCSLAAGLHAQDSCLWQSRLSGVSGEGFYRVLLSPLITARSVGGYDDLRIVDSAGHYVPYLLQSEVPFTRAETPEGFSFTTHTDSFFSIDIENPKARLCDEFRLTLRNTDIGAVASMTGSDDGHSWYTISDVVIHPGHAVRADTYEQMISLPPVKYQHLRLSIPMKRAIPFNVVGVAAYEAFIREGKYTALPAPHILPQRDSARTSYIEFFYEERYSMDKLIIHIDGPRYYHRTARLMVRQAMLREFTLSSDGDNIINVEGESNMVLEIDNEDNPPLKVRSFEALQLNKYAAMYLDGDRDYFLVFGNYDAKAPVYDIGYFQDSMRIHGVRDLTSGPVVKNTIKPLSEAVKPAAKNGLKAYWIWPVLIVVLGVLLFFTFMMGKEIGAKESA